MGAVFLAIVVVAIVIFALIPSDDTADVTVPDETPDAVTATPSASEGFDLKVLNRRVYQLLNRQLVQEGAIPVQPPAGVGKANPFL